VRLGWSGVRAAGKSFSLQPGDYSKLTALNLQPTANQERNDQCGNQHHSHVDSDNGHNNARNMLSL
jgi:hypothetical protein